MSTYATTALLQARYESTEAAAFVSDSNTATPDSTVLQEVLDHAEGIINSYLASRYAVPVTVTAGTTLNHLLTNTSLDIAMYQLAMRQGYATDLMTAVHDRTIDYLKSIAAGEVYLPSTAELPTSESFSPAASWGKGNSKSDDSDSNRLFTRADQDSL